MLNSLKNVAKFFFYIIRRLSITLKINNNVKLKQAEQQIDVKDEKLHYNIRKKIISTSKKIKTFALKRRNTLLPILWGETMSLKKM